MSYDQTIKKHILSLLDTGHRHYEMSKMMECNYCGNRFKKAEKEYKRLSRQYPEKFIRKEPGYDDTKSQLLNERLQDRINNDSLYYKHNRILQSGKPEEKRKEIKRFWSGFYEKHTGDWRKKTI